MIKQGLALGRRWVAFLGAKPHIATILLLVAYLAVFQAPFFWTGDVWAEAYAEYLVMAVTAGWEAFFVLGWAGYFNFIPKVLSDIYVSAHLPIGYIDYYYRFVVVAYTVLSAAFIAHPWNRRIIKHDSLRILLALATLQTLYHISSFSFINVWYIGFVVVVLVSLNPARLRPSRQVLYAIFAAAVCLTKPSIPLLPLVIYRAVKTKEYVSGGIVAAAIGLQTLLMLLAYQNHSLEHIRMSTKAAIMTLGSGLLFLKTLHIYPSSIWIVVLATLSLTVMCFYIAKTRGLIFWAASAVPLALCVYMYYFVPDLPTPTLFKQFHQIYWDDFKLQRATLISFLFLLWLYLVADKLIDRLSRSRAGKAKGPLLVIAPLALLILVQYRPIDMQAASFSADMTQFRAGLNAGQSLCMPIAPNPGWKNYLNVYPGDWFYQHYGGCMPSNYGKLPHPGVALDKGLSFAVPNKPGQQLKSLLVAVYRPHPERASQLKLTDTTTGRTFAAILQVKTNNEPLSYLAFNLHDDPLQENYRFVLSEAGVAESPIQVGRFPDGSVAYYGLSMGYPNLSERRP